MVFYPIRGIIDYMQRQTSRHEIAQFSGFCVKCGKPIYVGDKIEVWITTYGVQVASHDNCEVPR